MSKASSGNYFEDFDLGLVLSHSTPRTITSGDVALYISLTGSRHLLHCSAPDAKRAGFADQLVDDLLAFHIAFGKTVNDISLNAAANLGYADVRFLEPVYIGDTIKSQSEVIGLKENSSGKTGVVYVRSNAWNQDGKLVLTWIRWVMVNKKNVQSAAPVAHVPELPAFVAPENLPVFAEMRLDNFDTAASGSTHRWSDYKAGEFIWHVDGITIDESDHTQATRLYQNNARVHFNQHQMQDSRFGKRLVYGGHIISLARSLSFNGLANAVRIAAINSGSHTNPSFAGDTIYAATKVLNQWALPGRNDIGALRLRTLALKNPDQDKVTFPESDQGRKIEYDSNMVLDLDYTVLMPI